MKDNKTTTRKLNISDKVFLSQKNIKLSVMTFIDKF